MKKEFGVLCHISSLVSNYGVGDFGRSSFEFIDFLAKQKIDIWQVLPLTETNEYNCPYGSMCYFAFDTMFIDPEDLVERGLISRLDEVRARCELSPKVDYAKVKKIKLELLDIAYKNITKDYKKKLASFQRKNIEILDYALYKGVMEFNQQRTDIDVNNLTLGNAIINFDYVIENPDIITKTVFFQYLLSEQWAKVKAYAKKKGVKILGDMPIYPSPKSFDVFNNAICFKLDKKGNPLVYGGVPADDFCDNGQNWGSCIYDWDYLKKNNYNFIVQKVKKLLKNYDILRLDHYLGYVEHYEIDAKNPKVGTWVQEGGEDFFSTLKKNISLKKVVIEDLGICRSEPERVKKLFNLKGMRVLQFAWHNESEHLPKNIDKNCIFYLGTHDNNTFIGFLESLSKEKRAEFLKLMEIEDASNQEVLVSCVQKMIESRSDTVVLQIQDLLMQDASARMNVPGRAEGCWDYRLPKDYQERVNQNLKLMMNKK
ncbi:MAG: 4-alpha-glucanotransferase [Clostridia bacterium]|nr:4-alpha-glucanotransferase [Clostridia bacterium]